MRTHLARVFIVALAVLIGLSLVSRGSLAAGVGQACGGAARTACDAGLWCEHQQGMCSNAAAQGTCVELPIACAAIFQPVCGCDKKTYGNDCERRGKAQKDHDGPCK